MHRRIASVDTPRGLDTVRPWSDAGDLLARSPHAAGAPSRRPTSGPQRLRGVTVAGHAASSDRSRRPAPGRLFGEAVGDAAERGWRGSMEDAGALKGRVALVTGGASGLG